MASKKSASSAPNLKGLEHLTRWLILDPDECGSPFTLPDHPPQFRADAEIPRLGAEPTEADLEALRRFRLDYSEGGCFLDLLNAVDEVRPEVERKWRPNPGEERTYLGFALAVTEVGQAVRRLRERATLVLAEGLGPEGLLRVSLSVRTPVVRLEAFKVGLGLARRRKQRLPKWVTSSAFLTQLEDTAHSSALWSAIELARSETRSATAGCRRALVALGAALLELSQRELGNDDDRCRILAPAMEDFEALGETKAARWLSGLLGRPSFADKDLPRSESLVGRVIAANQTVEESIGDRRARAILQSRFTWYSRLAPHMKSPQSAPIAPAPPGTLNTQDEVDDLNRAQRDLDANQQDEGAMQRWKAAFARYEAAARERAETSANLLLDPKSDRTLERLTSALLVEIGVLDRHHHPEQIVLSIHTLRATLAIAIDPGRSKSEQATARRAALGFYVLAREAIREAPPLAHVRQDARRPSPLTTLREMLDGLATAEDAELARQVRDDLLAEQELLAFLAKTSTSNNRGGSEIHVPPLPPACKKLLERLVVEAKRRHGKRRPTTVTQSQWNELRRALGKTLANRILAKVPKGPLDDRGRLAPGGRYSLKLKVEERLLRFDDATSGGSDP